MKEELRSREEIRKQEHRDETAANMKIMLKESEVKEVTNPTSLINQSKPADSILMIGKDVAGVLPLLMQHNTALTFHNTSPRWPYCVINMT
jgi:hypothetical protein